MDKRTWNSTATGLAFAGFNLPNGDIEIIIDNFFSIGGIGTYLLSSLRIYIRQMQAKAKHVMPIRSTGDVSRPNPPQPMHTNQVQ